MIDFNFHITGTASVAKNKGTLQPTRLVNFQVLSVLYQVKIANFCHAAVIHSVGSS